MSSSYDEKLKQHRKKMAKELQEWERIKKKKNDEALRKVFSDEEECEEEEKDEWEEKTEEVEFKTMEDMIDDYYFYFHSID